MRAPNPAILRLLGSLAQDATERLNAAPADSPEFEALETAWRERIAAFQAEVERHVGLPSAQIRELLA